MEEQLDDVTGLSRKVIIESKDKGSDKRPRITLKDEDGHVLKLSNGMAARYSLPVGANIVVTEESQINAGAILAKIPRENHQDQGYYRWSSPGCRTFRGPQAQGVRSGFRN